MSLLTKIKVGDIISHRSWGLNRYKVQEIKSSEILLLNIYEYWEGWTPLNSLTKGIIINGVIAEEYDPNKTAIERKIAFMRKRFEERNNATKDW